MSGGFLVSTEDLEEHRLNLLEDLSDDELEM